MKEFENKVALISGGTRGIGRAIALELGRRGAKVAFTYKKSEEKAKTLVEELEALGTKGLAFAQDVINYEGCATVVNSVKETFGQLDFLVNNAGITRDRLLMMMKEDDWKDVLDTNLSGVFNLSKACVSIMMRVKSGKILNIASVSGIVGVKGQVNYCAAKAGMIGFTKALSKEVGRLGITVNALALGFIETDMTAPLPEKAVEEIKKNIPLQRFGTVDEASKVAAFLLSDAASYITGSVIVMDGGMTS